MTPLPRWVFLALLASSVVGFAAHRKDDACVPICRAQKRSPEKIGGGCDHRRNVLQSDGDHSAVRRLFRSCLIPCDAPGVGTDRLFFQDTADCRSFREKLIVLRSCACDSSEDARPSGIPYTWEYWADRLFRDHAGVGSGERDPWTMKRRGLSEEGSLSGERMAMEDLKELDYPDSLEMEATPIANMDSESGTTSDPNLSEEYPVDWEMWCMAQCDNGQGGSACNCDIIP